jgi:hypothetical protein
VLDAGHRTSDLTRPGQSRSIGSQEMGTLVEHAFIGMLDRRASYHAV